MKEATVVDNVVAEKPKATKTKNGDKVEKVEGAVKTPKAPKATTITKYRVLDGVDASKFRGQRQIVVKALQSLGTGFFTVAEIAAKCDGLVSKTPVEASAKYHLNGLVTDKEVEAIEETVAPAASTEAAA